MYIVNIDIPELNVYISSTYVMVGQWASTFTSHHARQGKDQAMPRKCRGKTCNIQCRWQKIIQQLFVKKLNKIGFAILGVTACVIRS